MYDNKLYGLPTPRGRAGNQLNAHQEILDQAGIGPIKSADDFKRALQAVNRPQANVYAIGDHNSFSYSRFLAAQTFGAPNNWKLDSSGKLVKDYETDEFKAGLGLLRDLWAAGLFHPNPNNNNSRSRMCRSPKRSGVATSCSTPIRRWTG